MAQCFKANLYFQGLDLSVHVFPVFLQRGATARIRASLTHKCTEEDQCSQHYSEGREVYVYTKGGRCQDTHIMETLQGPVAALLFKERLL